MITGPNGSKYWTYGLDVDLKKGDPVYSPVNGTIVGVGPNGGFGNQVRVKDANGNIIALSHLDGINAQVGQKVHAGQLVGKGGNTGNVYSTSGGDGSHLDITIYGTNGKPWSAPQVQKYVQEMYSKEYNSPQNQVNSVLQSLVQSKPTLPTPQQSGINLIKSVFTPKSSTTRTPATKQSATEALQKTLDRIKSALPKTITPATTTKKTDPLSGIGDLSKGSWTIDDF